jgi:Domain of unknown function (DUF4169)
VKVVSLNKARKAKARAEDRAQADANAVKFGRTKAEKASEALAAAQAKARLDGQKRE